MRKLNSTLCILRLYSGLIVNSMKKVTPYKIIPLAGQSNNAYQSLTFFWHVPQHRIVF